MHACMRATGGGSLCLANQVWIYVIFFSYFLCLYILQLNCVAVGLVHLLGRGSCYIFSDACFRSFQVNSFRTTYRDASNLFDKKKEENHICVNILAILLHAPVNCFRNIAQCLHCMVKIDRDMSLFFGLLEELLNIAIINRLIGLCFSYGW